MGQNVTLVKQGGNPTFASLTVNGPTNLSGSFNTSGSLNVSGSIFVSGSLVVSGSIIAQSLVVNTTTYSSGSNVFGNLSSNTQVFTGSMYVTGSSATFSGNVGIGTSSPNFRLSVVGAGTYTAGAVDVGEFADQISGGSKRGVTLGYYANGTSATAGSIRVPNNGDLLINASGGNVGIGNTNTSYTLDVSVQEDLQEY